MKWNIEMLASCYVDKVRQQRTTCRPAVFWSWHDTRVNLPGERSRWLNVRHQLAFIRQVRWNSDSNINTVRVPGLRIDPPRLLAGCRKRRLNQALFNLRGLIWLLMMDWSERGNIRKRCLLWEPYRKNSALCSWQANQSWFKERRNPQVPDGSARGNKKKRMLPHRPMQDRELEVPTVANRALGLMLILGLAVAQKDRCYLVGHLRMPRARWSVLSRNRKKHHIIVRDLLRFLTSSRRFS